MRGRVKTTTETLQDAKIDRIGLIASDEEITMASREEKRIADCPDLNIVTSRRRFLAAMRLRDVLTAAGLKEGAIYTGNSD